MTLSANSLVIPVQISYRNRAPVNFFMETKRLKKRRNKFDTRYKAAMKKKSILFFIKTRVCFIRLQLNFQRTIHFLFCFKASNSVVRFWLHRWKTNYAISFCLFLNLLKVQIAPVHDACVRIVMFVHRNSDKNFLDLFSKNSWILH